MNHYKLVFDGTISEGHQVEEVKKNLASLLKANEKQIELLFSEPEVIIKKNMDYASAVQYQKALQKTGTVCKVVEAAPPQVASPFENKIGRGIGDVIAGVVLIGIGLVWGGSIFLGTADALDVFFDCLGIFWIVKGISKMVR